MWDCGPASRGGRGLYRNISRNSLAWLALVIGAMKGLGMYRDACFQQHPSAIILGPPIPTSYVTTGIYSHNMNCDIWMGGAAFIGSSLQ